MKKLTLFVILFAVLTLTACNSKRSYPDYVQKLCGLDLSGCTIVSVEDTHGGFHGDGNLIVKFECAKIADSVIEQMEDWSTLPLTDNLQLFMYGTEGIIGNSEGFGIPELTNGHYFFWDRHSESTEPRSDSELNDRSSYNFTLLLYDSDHSQLYLFEIDT